MCEKVKKSRQFGNFGYLAHFFVMLDNKFEQTEQWQIGFYKKQTREIESFVLSEPVTAVEKSRAFTHDSKDVQELDLSKVKIEFKRAIEIANKFQEQNYKGQPPRQVIVILQCLDSITTWNITFITYAYSTLNMKINAESGDVYKHDFGTLLHWGGK